MNYILLALASVTASAKAIICKAIGQNNADVRNILFLNGNIFAVAATAVLLYNSRNVNLFINISPYSLLLAWIFAVSLLFTQINQVFAMSRGFASLSSLIYSCGFLVPIFYSAIFLSESISVFQGMGLLLLLVSLVLLLPPERKGTFSFTWLAFAVLSMLGSGINAVIQKIHQASIYKGELIPFLFFALLFASVLSFACSFFPRKDKPVSHFQLYRKRKTVILMALGGFVVGITNITNLKLAGQLPAVVQFPVYNICSMGLTALGGKLIFGEKIGVWKTVGFFVGMAAIIIIGVL